VAELGGAANPLEPKLPPEVVAPKVGPPALKPELAALKPELAGGIPNGTAPASLNLLVPNVGGKLDPIVDVAEEPNAVGGTRAGAFPKVKFSDLFVVPKPPNDILVPPDCPN
jgi:hypothetical protein